MNYDLNSRGKPFMQRIDCWNDTVRIAKSLPKPPDSIKYHLEDIEFPKSKYEKTRVSVERIDSLDCGILYKSLGYNPIVLNLADDFMPGGAVNLGSGAGEESIFRRTNLCETLDQKLYPIKDDEGIYSPRIRVFKMSEKDDWKLYLDDKINPIYLDILSVPGVRYPNLKGDKMNESDLNRLRLKVRMMLLISYKTGHDLPILGASGAGAWKCPAEDVAKVFKEVIQEFDGVFKLIVFAILGDADGRKNNNYSIFSDIFNPEKYLV